MKKFKNTIFPIMLTIIMATSVSTLLADTPPNPPTGGGHGTGGNLPPGGSAPIGGGTFILIALGAVYGGKKIYDMNKEELED